MTTELDTFYEMVEDIGIAMMTTRRPDGHLESRAPAGKTPFSANVPKRGSKRACSATLRRFDDDQHTAVPEGFEAVD